MVKKLSRNRKKRSTRQKRPKTKTDNEQSPNAVCDAGASANDTKEVKTPLLAVEPEVDESEVDARDQPNVVEEGENTTSTENNTNATSDNVHHAKDLGQTVENALGEVLGLSVGSAPRMQSPEHREMPEDDAPEMNCALPNLDIPMNECTPIESLDSIPTLEETNRSMEETKEWLKDNNIDEVYNLSGWISSFKVDMNKIQTSFAKQHNYMPLASPRNYQKTDFKRINAMRNAAEKAKVEEQKSAHMYHEFEEALKAAHAAHKDGSDPATDESGNHVEIELVADFSKEKEAVETEEKERASEDKNAARTEPSDSDVCATTAEDESNNILGIQAPSSEEKEKAVEVEEESPNKLNEKDEEEEETKSSNAAAVCATPVNEKSSNSKKSFKAFKNFIKAFKNFSLKALVGKKKSKPAVAAFSATTAVEESEYFVVDVEEKEKVVEAEARELNKSDENDEKEKETEPSDVSISANTAKDESEYLVVGMKEEENVVEPEADAEAETKEDSTNSTKTSEDDALEVADTSERKASSFLEQVQSLVDIAYGDALSKTERACLVPALLERYAGQEEHLFVALETVKNSKSQKEQDDPQYSSEMTQKNKLRHAFISMYKFITRRSI